MLIVTQDKSRKEEYGQIFVELTKNRGLDIVNCDRLGYWCDKAHLSHFIIECANCFTENELKDILKMNKETIEIKKDSVIAIYNTARNTNDYGTLHALETLFGIDFFKPQDVRERIKTFEDACRELGENHPLVSQYKFNYSDEGGWNDDKYSADLKAYLKLRIICAALNERWNPKFTKDEVRWYPWFWFYTQEEIDNMDEEEKQDRHLISTGDYQTGYAGFGCASSSVAPSNTAAGLGSRLCLKSDALAIYCGRQFINIWMDFICG